MTNKLPSGTLGIIATLAVALIISMPMTMVLADDDIIGSQTSKGNLDNGVHNLVSCLGNVLLPSTICVGTKHDDKIIGQGPEHIYGLDGDDVIQAMGGPDVVYGGDGDDTIQGGEGVDVIFGEDGDDVLFGDSGTNIIFGAGGNTLYGGKGDDHLYGGSDNDVLIGGPGHDYFDCNEGADTVVDYDPSEDTVNTNCEVLQ